MTSRQKELFEQMRESYALVDELGLPNIKSDYWNAVLTEGRQGEGGKGARSWLDFTQQRQASTTPRPSISQRELRTIRRPHPLEHDVSRPWSLWLE